MKSKTIKRRKQYTVTDGTLVLTLESDGGKWLVVTSPFDPELVTQAKNIDDAFAMAYDAKKLLDECRAERAKSLLPARKGAAKSPSVNRRRSVKV